MSILLLSAVYGLGALFFASVVFINKLWFLVLVSLVSGLCASILILIFESIESFGSQPAPMSPIKSTRRDNMSEKISFYFVALFSASCISLYVKCMPKRLPEPMQSLELSKNKPLNHAESHAEEESDQY